MKKKNLKKIKEKLEKYNPRVEVAKSIGFNMLKDKRTKIIPDKTKYSKKDRKKNKMKF